MGIDRIFLSPFTGLYRLITDMRNFLYDSGRRHSAEFTIPVINVGNLTVGGTGKSPMIEYLVNMLAADYEVATLSRGYGRKTRGFRLADADDDAESLGDEPYQFYLKFGNRITVAVGEERALAIPSILLEREHTQVVLLDDAYQHRAVSPHLNILLSDYNRPFYKDVPLPGGRLRESRKGARRANVVVVTKCPADMNTGQKEIQKKHIQKYAGEDAPVFFTTIGYEDVRSFDTERTLPAGSEVVAFSGIARPEPFVRYASSKFTLHEHLKFPDHHTYADSDLAKIKVAHERYGSGNKQVCLLTTEKDAVRLGKKAFSGLPVYYIPIRPVFLDSEEQFKRIVRTAVEKELGG